MTHIAYFPQTKSKLLACVALAATLAWACPGYGQTTPADMEVLKQKLKEEGLRLNELTRSLARQAEQLQSDRAALDAQRLRINALIKQLGMTDEVATLGESPIPAPTLQAQAGRGAQDIAQAPTEPQSPQAIGQAPKKTDTKPPEVAPIFQQPGVLTPKGKFAVEPSLQYAYSSSNRVSVIGFEIFPALLIGVLDIRTANRTSYTATLTGRYGLTNRFEIEAKLPYVYRQETLQTREFLQASFRDNDFDSSGNGIGDVEVTGRYQFNTGGMEKAYYVGTLRLKTRTGKDQFQVDRDPDFPRGGGRLKEQPTGTGFYGVQPGLTVIYPTDPAVFFGSLSYLWNIKRSNLVDSIGRHFGEVDPGDAVTFNFGMGLSLNERASFSIGYDHSIFGKTKVDGVVAPGELTTQLGTLLLGFSYKLTAKTNMNLSLGIGVTKDAPDVQLTLRLPTMF
ncbi:MAG: acetate kinase [Burkholderiales bacterium]